MEREIKVGNVYKHFKGHVYKVVEIAYDSEVYDEDNPELSKVVVYQDVENGKCWVRPYQMFNSLMDNEKYPGVKQKYRFEEQSVIKPILFINDQTYTSIGISKPVGHDELMSRTESGQGYYEIRTNHGGMWGSDINVFCFDNGDMIHSQLLNTNEIVIYYNMDNKEYEVNVIKKDGEKRR